MRLELTNSQQIAFDALLRGENVFLTGGAGTGKTTIIKEFIEQVDPNCSYTILAAPTGKAAINLHIGDTYGSTIHKVFHLKAEALPKFRESQIPPMLRIARRIIIDEISMLRLDLFDYVADALLCENSRRDLFDEEPIQIILVGDFFQLPPVLKRKAQIGASDYDILKDAYGEDVGKGYCFQSCFWDVLEIKMYELTEIMRQKDDLQFCEALNKIRKGDPTGIKYINENRDHTKGTSSYTTICGVNSHAEAINKKWIDKNRNTCRAFKWKVVNPGILKNIDSMLKDIPCIETLELFIGAKVICIANNPCAVNGQIGEVQEITSDYITVKWASGEINDVEKYEWEFNRQEIVRDPLDAEKSKIVSKPIFSVIQFPLKLAYAMTVHKAQGETIKEGINVWLDLFETGHLYTALSRCPDIHKIRLTRALMPQDVNCDKSIIKFYEQGGTTL